MKSPAYQWYPKDILSSTRVAMMDARTECWYRRALDYCWINGSIPSDPRKLAAMVGKGCTAKSAAADLIPMFSAHPDDDNKLVHERQEEERRKQEAWREKTSQAGKKSAALRQQKGNVSSTKADGLVESLSPNSSNKNPTLQSPSSIPTIVGKAPPPEDPIPVRAKWPGLGDKQAYTAELLNTLTEGKLPRMQIEHEAKALIAKNPDPPYPYITKWAANIARTAAQTAQQSTEQQQTQTDDYLAKRKRLEEKSRQLGG